MRAGGAGQHRGAQGSGDPPWAPGSPPAPPLLPEPQECRQGSGRCSGTGSGAQDGLPGRRCISRLRGKSAAGSSLPLRAGTARGRSSGHVPGTVPGDLPAQVSRTHRRGCRIPSGGTCCAFLQRLSRHRGPGALSGAFIASRQLHALLRGRRRGGGRLRWGRRERSLIIRARPWGCGGAGTERPQQAAGGTVPGCVGRPGQARAGQAGGAGPSYRPPTAPQPPSLLSPSLLPPISHLQPP